MRLLGGYFACNLANMPRLITLIWLVCIEEDATFDSAPIFYPCRSEVNCSMHPIGLCIYGRRYTSHRAISRVVIWKRLGFQMLLLYGGQKRRYAGIHDHSLLRVVGLQPSNSADPRPPPHWAGVQRSSLEFLRASPEDGCRLPGEPPLAGGRP